MANPWKEKVYAFNKKRKAEGEKALDLDALLNAIAALPPGQKNKLVEACPELGAVFDKHKK